MPSVSVQRLFTDNRERLDLCWLAGQQGSLRVVTVGALSDSTAGLIAHLNLTHPHRFQVLGAHEMAYLQSLDEGALATAWEGIFSSELVAIFLSEGCVLLPALAERAEQRSIPVMGASVDSTSVINQIRHYLSQELAEQESLHGVFMVILEVGVLITGDSGAGKSELALELITRGNGLVADDVVEFYRITPDTLQGRCPPLLRDFLEVRGLGLLNIRSIFGETAVRPRKNLKLIVHLERPSSGDLNTCERLPMGRQTQSILGVAIPRVVLPVAVGRNLAVLVEAATRNFILEQRGINSTQEFIDRQQQFMQESCAQGIPMNFSEPGVVTSKVVLISGLSGSGKSVALRALEDAGYFAMDNFPLSFLVFVLQELVARGERQIALTLDVRGGNALNNLPEALHTLRDNGLDVRLLYLEASDQDLIRRFSETRRPHPLALHQHSLAECIALERNLLSGVADLARRFDTTHITPNTLRAWVRDFVDLDPARLTLFFQSFGFKFGIPLDADFVFDLRCIPNPFYDPHLRPLTGQDPAVIKFLENLPIAQRMFTDLQTFVTSWMPDFIKDNRAALTVSLGCTGGQHRSVYFAEKLTRYFSQYQCTRVIHRELDREGGDKRKAVSNPL